MKYITVNIETPEVAEVRKVVRSLCDLTGDRKPTVMYRGPIVSESESVKFVMVPTLVELKNTRIKLDQFAGSYHPTYYDRCAPLFSVTAKNKNGITAYCEDGDGY